MIFISHTLPLEYTKMDQYLTREKIVISLIYKVQHTMTIKPFQFSGFD